MFLDFQKLFVTCVTDEHLTPAPGTEDIWTNAITLYILLCTKS